MRVGPPPGALAEREFRLLFLARTVSALGNRLAPIALAFAVLELTGSVTDLGLVIAANQAASVVCLLAGGVWADRLPRHQILCVTDLLQGVAQLATAGLLLTGSAHIWELMVLQAIYGAAGGFWTPAARGIVPSTVSGRHLQQANSLLTLSTNTMGIAGPALGGLLVVAGSPAIAIAFDAATFVASALFVGSMRLGVVRSDPRSAFLDELRGGWAAFRSRRWLWMSVALFCVGNFLEAGPFYVLGPAIAKLHLGGAGTWGLILSAGGIGSVAGGLAALRFRPSRPLLWMNIGWGISLSQLYLLALVAPAWVLIAAAAVAGAAISVDLTLWFTVIQSTIPTGSLSRVSSYDELGSFIFEPLSFACVGIVAGHVGTARTLWLAAGGCSAVFLAGIATPSIRNLRLERLGPATEP